MKKLTKTLRNALYVVVAVVFAMAIAAPAQAAPREAPAQRAQAAQQAAPPIDDSDLLELEARGRKIIDNLCKLVVFVNTGVKVNGVPIIAKVYTCESRRASCHRGKPVYSSTIAVCVISFEKQPRLNKKGERIFPGFPAEGCTGAAYYKKLLNEQLRAYIRRVRTSKLQCRNIDKG